MVVRCLAGAGSYLYWCRRMEGQCSFQSYTIGPGFWLVGSVLIIATFIFYFFFCFPFSIEYNFTPSLGTDLPSEPIMMLMTGIGVLLFSYRLGSHNFSKYFNTITYVLLFHLSWIFVTSVLSDFPVLSFKIFAAKLWYIIPFYFLTMHILVSHHEVGKMIKSGVFTLAIAIIIVLVRHAARDFAFEEANFVVTPIFSQSCQLCLHHCYLFALPLDPAFMGKITWNEGNVCFLDCTVCHRNLFFLYPSCHSVHGTINHYLFCNQVKTHSSCSFSDRAEWQRLESHICFITTITCVSILIMRRPLPIRGLTNS